MSTRHDELFVVTGGMSPLKHAHKVRHGLLVSIVCGVVLISALQVIDIPANPPAAIVAGPVQSAPAQQSAADADYFPAQYRNQAQMSEAEEHIQAF